MRERLFALLFGGVFAAVGIFMGIWAGRDIWLWMQSSSWQRVPATIQDLELQHDDDTDRVLCTYSYAFNGRVYRGDAPSIYNTADNFGPFHQDLYERLKADSDAGTLTCLVDPANPQRSLLDRTYRPGMLAVQLIFTIVFGTIGLTVLAYFLTTCLPREVGGRLQIDSSHRPSRASAKMMLLYHGLITLVVVPVSLICLLGGNFFAIAPLALVTASIAAFYLCWQYMFVKHPVIGKLLLPDRVAQNRDIVTVLLPPRAQGPVDLETRWVVPAPPSNRVGVEDETGDSSYVEMPAAGGTSNVTELDLPMPELPADIPNDGAVKLEVMGTVGGYKYHDEFTLGETALVWLREDKARD